MSKKCMWFCQSIPKTVKVSIGSAPEFLCCRIIWVHPPPPPQGSAGELCIHTETETERGRGKEPNHTKAKKLHIQYTLFRSKTVNHYRSMHDDILPPPLEDDRNKSFLVPVGGTLRCPDPIDLIFIEKEPHSQPE